MIIPAAANIEIAIDSLLTATWVEKSEVEELHSAVGNDRATKLVIAYPLSSEFEKGYVVGVHAARQVVAGSMQLLLKGVKPSDVL